MNYLRPNLSYVVLNPLYSGSNAIIMQNSCSRCVLTWIYPFSLLQCMQICANPNAILRCIKYNIILPRLPLETLNKHNANELSKIIPPYSRNCFYAGIKVCFFNQVNEKLSEWFIWWMYIQILKMLKG